MRKILYILIAPIVGLLLGVTACNPIDDNDTTEKLELSADRSRIIIEDGEVVTFTVTLNKQDVTDSATISDVTDAANPVALSGNTFTTTVVGEYKFAAEREGKQSEPLIINVISQSKGLVLKADKVRVVSEDGEVVTFTVLFDGEDVTSEAKIMNVTDPDDVKTLDDNTFTTYIAGRYRFTAFYNYSTSDQLTIEAVNGSGVAANYYRRVQALYFTGTWCTYCPQMHVVLNLVKEEFPERVVSIAIHGNDEYSLGTEGVLATMFGVSAYPTAIIDFRPDKFTSNSTLIKAAVRKSIGEYPAVSGIKVKTTVAPTAVTIDTEIAIAQTNYWKIWVAVVQDGIKGSQSGYSAEYTFDDVVRTYLTKSCTGDELGQRGSGEKVSNTFTLKTDENMDLSNFRVVVAAMNSQNNTSAYYVNNIVSCPLGGEIDYQYEEE